MRVLLASIVRRRLAAVTLVSLLVAVLLGGALAAFDGARRSDRALDGLLAYSAPEDVFVSNQDATPGCDPCPEVDPEAIQRLPNVLGSIFQVYLAMTLVDDDGAHPELTGAINPYLYVPGAGPPGTVNRLRIVAGRDLDPSAPDEVVIDEELARQRGLRVSSTLRMAAYTPDQFGVIQAGETSGAGWPAPKGPTIALAVVGIARMPVDIRPDEEAHTTSFGGTKDIYLTPTFLDRYQGQIAAFGGPDSGSGLGVRLAHGLADLDSFRAAVHKLPNGEQLVVDASDSDALGAARSARRAISVETNSLLAIAGLLFVSGSALAGHGLARLARSTAADLGALRAIGVGPTSLRFIASAPATAAVGFGVIGAGVVAVVASSRTPIGLAGRAELQTGVHVDVPFLALALGGLLVVGGIAAWLVAGPTTRTMGVRARGTFRPGLADWLSRASAPLTPTLGARFATSNGTEQVAPLRSAVVAAATALLVLGGVATFTTSLDHLRSTPAAQGETWDLAIGNINLSDYSRADMQRLAADPRIDGVSAVAATQGRDSISGQDIAIAGFVAVEGSVGPPLLAGRLPTSTGEVLLGQRSAERLGVGLGDTVTLDREGGGERVTLVGIGLVSSGISPSMQIGEGALVTVEQLDAVRHARTPITFLLATVASGYSIEDTIIALRDDWGRNVARPVNDAEVVNLARVRAVPVTLALALAAAALTLVAAALLLSARQRHHDLAVLRAIGATSRQVRAVLLWEGFWLYGIAALAGLPFGIVAGRTAWGAIGHGVGAITGPSVPLATIAESALAGIVAVEILSLVAHWSARPHFSRPLRIE